MILGQGPGLLTGADKMDDELWDNADKNGNIKSDFVQTSIISEEQMQELIESYNGAPHRSIGKSQFHMQLN